MPRAVVRSGDRLEHQLFEYKEREQTDDATFEFEDITLVVPIGDYPVGTTFAHATLDYELALLNLYDRKEGDVSKEDDEPTCSAKLLLTAIEYSKFRASETMG
jgi:hypothetical protein